MRIDDTKMTKMIMDMFAGRPIRLLDKEIPFLYNMKVYSYNQQRHLSIIRLDYRDDVYECAKVDMIRNIVCGEPEFCFSVYETAEWLSKQINFLDGK